MYKNVIFDIGGGMGDFYPRDFFLDRVCDAALLEKSYRLSFGSATRQKLGAGPWTRAQGNPALPAAPGEEGCAFEVQEVLENWTSILRIRRRMVELVRRLKNHGYCVYYLSNIPEDILPLLMSRGLEGVFDGGVASCDVHINKPDPRIYQCLLDQYRLTASECIFIDDSRANVQTAFQLGMNSIQMRESVDTLVRSLATCNVTLR